MGSIKRPETSVNYQYTLRHIPEQRELQLLRNDPMPALLGMAFFFLFLNFFGGGRGRGRGGFTKGLEELITPTCSTGLLDSVETSLYGCVCEEHSR